MSTALRVLRQLIQPLYFAAYVTWLAVLLVLLDTPITSFLNGERGTALAIMVIFLAAFLIKGIPTSEPTALERLSTARGGRARGARAVRGLAAQHGAGPHHRVHRRLRDAAGCDGADRRRHRAERRALDHRRHVLANVATCEGPAPVHRFSIVRRAHRLVRKALREDGERPETDQRPPARHALVARGERARSRTTAPRERIARCRRPQIDGPKAQPDRARAQRLGPQPQVKVASQLATELLDDIRGVVAQIRQHDGLDLRQALTQLIAPLPTPRIHLSVAEDARVDSVAQAETLLRIVQEALTNIVRHAHADNAWIDLRRDGECSAAICPRRWPRHRTAARRVRAQGHARTHRRRGRHARGLARPVAEAWCSASRRHIS